MVPACAVSLKLGTIFYSYCTGQLIVNIVI